MTASDAVVQWFPLIARPRPHCGPVEERIAVVRKLADDAATGDARNGLAWAAQAQNLAALIASDCGLPDHARALCWQHYNAYLDARPLAAREARFSLEPLVNLARLQIRAEDGLAAYALLSGLWQALNDATPVNIDGTTVSLSGLTATPEDLTDVRSWLWTVLIADGPRALISAGHWQQAREHVERHRGIGNTLLDGRQIVIIAVFLSDGPAAALPLVDQTQRAHPWEEAVHSCLEVLCRSALGDDIATPAATMQERYLRLSAEPGTHMFRARLGLTVIDLLGGPEHPTTIPAMTHLIREADLAGDGYMAREVLTRLGDKGVLPEAVEEALVRTIRSSGLHGAGLPTDLEAELLDAAKTSKKAIGVILGTDD